MVSVDTVEDVRGRSLSLYPESRACTEALKTAGVKMCIASRSPVAGWYKQVLDAHNMLPDFDPVYIHGGGEIGYPGTKLGHFLNITKVTGIEFEDMIFMDDEYEVHFLVTWVECRCKGGRLQRGEACEGGMRSKNVRAVLGGALPKRDGGTLLQAAASE
eukprot:gene8762-10384_t